MAVSLGPFMTCFLAVLFLTVYIYIVIYVKKDILYSGMKLVFAGIALILIRMMIPFNFPFTQTITSHTIMPFISKLVFWYVGDIDFAVVLFAIWISVSVIKLLRLVWIQVNFRACLRPFAVKDMSRYPKLAQVLEKCGVSFHEICIVPTRISPAVFGIIKPILILPDCEFTEKELYYICRHEAEHCRNYDLLLRLFLDLVLCTQWFNPLVYFMKKELSLAFELSNDQVILNSMDEMERTEYAECVLKMVRYQNKNTAARGNSLPFAQVNCSNVKTRVRYIMAKEAGRKKNRISVLLNYVVIGAVLLASFLFVPEAYVVDGIRDNSVVSVSEYKTYFIEREGNFWLYSDGELIMGVPYIPKEFENIPVLKEEIESEEN